MGQETIRLGVVGYGSRGSSLFDYAARTFDGVLPAAVCDSDPERLSRARETWPHAGHFSDFDEMLVEGLIDTLLVETPATCHTEFCARALEHEFHVMSDVPPVASVAEAHRLWAAEERSSALFMTGANPNMAAWIEKVIELRARGVLGDPYYIECEYIHDIRDLWRESPWRETFEPVKYCTHDLGPVLRIIDEDLEWVSCFDTGSHINRVEGQHDAMAALFRTGSNIVVRFMASFINNRPQQGHQVRLYTTKGYFELLPPYLARDGAGFVYHSTDMQGNTDVTPLDIPSVAPRYLPYRETTHNGWDHALLDQFFTAVRSGGPAPISLRDGLRMTLPGIHAAESARRGGELLPITYPWTA